MALRLFPTLALAAAACVAGAGCSQGDRGAPKAEGSAAAQGAALNAEQTFALSPLESKQLAPLTLGGKSYLLAASEQRGLVLLAEDGSEVASLDGGSVERFALRALANDRWLLAAYDEDGGAIRLLQLAVADGQPVFDSLAAEPTAAPQSAMCFSHQGGRSHLFAIGENGLGREYVVHPGGDGWQFRDVRPLYFGEQVSGCAVDDSHGRLLVAQPPLGIWSLNADAERDEERDIFVAGAELGEEFNGVPWLDERGGALWLSAAGQVRAYSLDNPAAGPLFARDLEGVGGEPLSVSVAGNTLLALEEESDAMRFSVELPQASSQVAAEAGIAGVPAHAETQPVASGGDAADDPAIWINPQDASRSLILGTDKKSGLNVYDLSGRLLQQLSVGRVNNVDLRAIEHPQYAALAAASNRTTPGISLFGITPAGTVESLGLRKMDLDDPYGLCTYSRDGRTFAWLSDKEGPLHQVEIQLGAAASDWRLREVARLPVDSQVEGCVVDDERQTLFFGEEDRGVWRLDLAAFAAGDAEPQLVAEVDGENLVDDVEGVALYLNDEGDGGKSYLVVSSQGNNSYALFDRDGSEFVGHFRVEMNPQRGVDGSSETDGLEVTSAPLPDYPQGLLIVQDGRNRMPAATQNFKLVSWADIAGKLQL
ncbi:phytase [Microbulbifer litoralis]|uniref:phytase n=1 Tax=Microbulbifer litoralis TaxID=2933965 RepID=UPI002028C0FC|nr:phytase [Microbulbifer sp. GX H0434]